MKNIIGNYRRVMFSGGLINDRRVLFGSDDKVFFQFKQVCSFRFEVCGLGLSLIMRVSKITSMPGTIDQRKSVL